MIKIIKWWDQFENAGSRKLVTIRHFSSTAGNDSRGYRKLMRMGVKGLAAFGTFQALCQLMAGLGHAARKQGAAINSDGSILDLDDLSDLTRITDKALEVNIEILIGIGWLEGLKPLEAIQSPNDPPASPNDLPLIPQDNPKGEEGRGEEGRGEEGKKESLSLPFGSDDFREAWTEWISYLKEKKKTPTDRTKKAQLKKLKTLTQSDAIYTINNSIENGWQGLFPSDSNMPTHKGAGQDDLGGPRKARHDGGGYVESAGDGITLKKL